MKVSQIVTRILFIGLSLGIGTQALAVPMVDGAYQSADGYTHHWTIEPSKYEAGAEPMDLYMAQDMSTFDLYIAAILPKTYCDNTFGANSIGWTDKKGKPKVHKFDELVGSDKAQFVFTMNGTTVFDVKLDYIALDPDALSGYSCGGAVKSEKKDKTKSDGEMKVGDIADLLAARTSLDYNLNDLLGGNAYTLDSPAADVDYANPALAGWVYDIVYEFQIAGSVFNQTVLNANGLVDDFDMYLDELHASPHKIGEYKDTSVPPDPTDIIPPTNNVIPEPTTILLFGLAAAAASLRKKHRNRT